MQQYLQIQVVMSNVLSLFSLPSRCNRAGCTVYINAAVILVPLLTIHIADIIALTRLSRLMHSIAMLSIQYHALLLLVRWFHHLPAQFLQFLLMLDIATGMSLKSSPFRFIQTGPEHYFFSLETEKMVFGLNFH